jgi:hypothetical protein
VWSVAQTRATLRAILNEARLTREPVGPGVVSVIRSLGIANVLRLDRQNEEACSALRRCLVVLCLDQHETPHSIASAVRLAHAGDWENRWFNASLQWVVFANGMACGIVAFSAGIDGNVMSRALGAINTAANCVAESAPPKNQAFSYRLLKWNVPLAMAAEVRREARRHINSRRATFHLNGLGRNSLYHLGIRSAPLFSMALQMALVKALKNKRRFRVLQFVSREMFSCMGYSKADVTMADLGGAIDSLAGEGGRNNLLLRALAYMEAHDSACRRVRTMLTHLDMLNVLASRRSSRLSVSFARKVLRVHSALGLVRKITPPVHVNISCPAIAAGTSMIGRPGIIAPEAGLSCHYQVRGEQIILTFMQGSFDVNLDQLVDEIERVLRFLAASGGAATRRC